MISTVFAVATMSLAIVSSPPATSVTSFPVVLMPLVVTALAVMDPIVSVSAS